jgi:hypothetical protein
VKPSTRARPEAVFVVGVSRSGTTLMRTVLERSDQLAVAMESHYLGHLLPGQGARDQFRRLGDFADDTTMRRIVDFLYSGNYQRRSRWREISPFWRWLVREVPRAETERRLLAAERTERGLFRAFLRLYADERGNKPIMGEKTPAHLRFAETLLEWFPAARIVHVVRDPRAIYVSDRRRRRERPTRPFSWLMRVPLALEGFLLLQTALAWRAGMRRHRALAARHGESYLLVRFEDLVAQPEETVGRLFGFLGVPVPEAATQVKVVSRGANAGQPGFDASAAERWRTELHPFARRTLALLVGHQLAALGYRP